jgi:hypothetical protein
MLSVFYDTLFQTFAFVLNNPTSTALKGRVVAVRAALPGQEVIHMFVNGDRKGLGAFLLK